MCSPQQWSPVLQMHRQELSELLKRLYFCRSFIGEDVGTLNHSMPFIIIHSMDINLQASAHYMCMIILASHSKSFVTMIIEFQLSYLLERL
ncbi:hypothetical protein GDO81_028450 [Engystomops pustulosus]|uniref:Uncharacterized protein n=1 Tax=Engystomops pustulosus TaxID=76066 RepID=A0AAV6ZLC5_ENGPU|nr:hypothetical protein GDO81_028450 [Engystomops pustulosus]